MDKRSWLGNSSTTALDDGGLRLIPEVELQFKLITYPNLIKKVIFHEHRGFFGGEKRGRPNNVQRIIHPVHLASHSFAFLITFSPTK